MEVKEVLEGKHIDYKFSTKDYIIRCLSPEHEDNNPSCHVDKLTGVYHCWSCGDSGNIYDYFDLLVPNAVNKKVEILNNKISKLLLSKPLTIPLGSIPHEWEFRGISAKTLLKFEAFTSDDSVLNMEGRLIFPIKNIHGDIIAFLGRLMYSELGSKYDIYPQHSTLPIYPTIPNIIKGSIILVEGIFDFLNLYDKGLTNAVFANGINLGLVKKRSKKEINLQKLLEYKYQGVHTIHIMFDGDTPGRKAAQGLANYASKEFEINIIELEDDKDPGNMILDEVTKLKEDLYGRNTNS